MIKLNERELILANLATFAAQRPGLEFGNYGDVSSYRSELRSITKDLHHARALLAAIGWRESITAEKLKEAFRAFSGRLTWDGKKLDYCTGQYWPTEYRRAVCAVAASALWDYWRDISMGLKPDETTYLKSHKIENRRDYIITQAKKEFGASIVKRWFN